MERGCLSIFDVLFSLHCFFNIIGKTAIYVRQRRS